MTVNSGDTTPTGTSVAITPPAGTSAADFDKFVVSVCPAGTTSGCPTTDCAPANVSACAITGLSPGQTYTVSATAVKGSVTSLVGASATVTTPYP